MGECFVCYEELTDPRILPCWHSACLTCILGMTQTGPGRAVACHVCRESVMFENIRSLPKPITCKLCGSFVMSPKKFPCCNALCCFECISKSENEGIVKCPVPCKPDAIHTSADLPRARLCSICFTLHTEPARICGHHLCKSCKAQNPDDSGVCLATNGPRPVPVNPMGNAGSLFGVPVQQMLPGQQIDTEQLQQAWTEILRDLKQAVKKMSIFWAVLIVMTYNWGFGLYTWIVGALTMVCTRFSKSLGLITVNITRIVLFVMTIYYFIHALTLFIFMCAIHSIFSRVHSAASAIVTILCLYFVFPHYELIFIHTLTLDLALGHLPQISVAFESMKRQASLAWDVLRQLFA